MEVEPTVISDPVSDTVIEVIPDEATCAKPKASQPKQPTAAKSSQPPLRGSAREAFVKGAIAPRTPM
eukprot:5191557-Alexandrium_andersonii.AAC.1